MRVRSLALAVSVVAAHPATAQVSLHATGGVLVSSDLVRDSIVNRVDLGLDPGVSLGLELSSPLDSANGLGITLMWARNTLVTRENSSTRDIAHVTTWTPALVFRRKLRPWLSASLLMGVVVYDSDRAAGTPFRDDEPTDPILGAGLGIDHRLAGLMLGLEVAYDFHRFNTTALQTEGFASDRSVHRVRVTARVGR